MAYRKRRSKYAWNTAGSVWHNPNFRPRKKRVVSSYSPKNPFSMSDSLMDRFWSGGRMSKSEKTLSANYWKFERLRSRVDSVKNKGKGLFNFF